MPIQPNRQAMPLRYVEQLLPSNAGADFGYLAVRIHAHAAKPRRIDEHALSRGCQAAVPG
jgi:hypothetical protein